MTENTDGIEEQTCDMCKISYVTEKELRDHEWSLMHHIKVEQKKKGSIHKCSLCFTTCPNLIEYGKHLNGDKHKQAIEESRVQSETLDPQEIQYRLQSGEKEIEQEGQREPLVSEYPREARSHQRSYSQPQFRGHSYDNRQPYRGRPPPRFYDYEGYNYHDSFENPHYHRGGMRQMFPYQWRQPWESTSPDPWEHPNQIPEDMDFQFQDKNRKSNYRLSGDQYSEREKQNRLSGDQFSEREKQNRYEFMRPERDRPEPEIDKRKLDSDKNRKAVHIRFEDEETSGYSSQTQTSGYSSQTQTSQEAVRTKRRRRNTDLIDAPTSGRATKNSKSRSAEGQSHDLPVEADSTTDIEMVSQKTVTDKKGDAKKKTSVKTKKKKNVTGKNSPRADEGDSVLERAEKLCKELRDKREKAKKELHSKEKEKKIEKKDEINRQLAKFAEINKGYVKGVLDSADSPINKSEHQPSKPDVLSPSTPNKEKHKKINTSKSKTVKEKTKNSKDSQADKSPSRSEKLSIDVQNLDNKNESSPAGSKVKHTDHSKSIETPSKTDKKSRDIDEIRKEIELEVHKSKSPNLHENEKEDSLEKESKGDNTDNSTSSKPWSVVDSTSRETLLKMVNSPRSRKERQQLAEVLRTYAKSQNRLSLPRFNLNMSGLYDSLEHYDEFRLEELSPDVQLQIAELIEADIKPDLDELEKTLLSDIKEETMDGGYDKLELLDKSLNDKSTERIIANDIAEPKILTSDIKKEPEDIASSLKSNYPQSPQYSQEEREFIEKFCSAGSHEKQVDTSNSALQHSPHIEDEQYKSSHDLTDVSQQGVKQDIVDTRPPINFTLRSRSNSLSSLQSEKLSNRFTPEKADQKNLKITEFQPVSQKLEDFKEKSSNQNTYDTAKTQFMYEFYSKETEVSKPQPDNRIIQWPTSKENNIVMFPIKTSDIEPVKDKSSPAIWFGSQMSLSRQSQNEPILPKSSAVWFDSQMSPSRPSQSESISDRELRDKILTYTCKSLFGRTTTSEPLYATGSLAVSSNATVTTWSTFTGNQAQPLVPSSSETSLSSIRVRRPSETSIAESLVDTVYDISIKEEDTREELHEVEQSISRLQKLIEDSTVELNKYKEKKIALKKEEENLRAKRINVLQEARYKQRRPDSRHDSELSDRPTPPLSGTEDHWSKTVPTLLETFGIPPREKTEHVFSQPLYPVDKHIGYSRSDTVRSDPAINKPVETDPKSESSTFNPYLFRGPQTVNIMQGKNEYHRAVETVNYQNVPENIPASISPMKMAHDTRSIQTVSQPMMSPPILPHMHMGHDTSSVQTISQPMMSPSSMSHVKMGHDTNSNSTPMMSPPTASMQMEHYTNSNSTPMMSPPTSSIKIGQDTSSVSQSSSNQRMTNDFNLTSKQSAFNENLLSPNYIQQKMSELEKQSDTVTRINKQLISNNYSSPHKETENRKIENKMEDISMLSDDQKQDKIIIIHDSPKRSNQNSWVAAEKPDVLSPSKQGHSRSQIPLPSQEIKEKEHSDKQHQNIDKMELAKTADLKSFGFITLNNLMNSEESDRQTELESKDQQTLKQTSVAHKEPGCSKNPSIDPTEEERMKPSLKDDPMHIDQSKDPIPVNEGNRSNESEGMRQDSRDKMNIQYMGSLPHGIDQSELLKQFKSGKGKHDQMSYLVVDGDQSKAIYNKLQLLFTKPTSEVKGQLDVELDSNLKDSNYESVNSNSSLGEKIRQYCNKVEPILLSDEEQNDVVPANQQEERSTPSPFRKRLKTKKERDLMSIRKQKEGCILESSSDYNSADEDTKHGHKLKAGQKIKEADIEIISDKEDGADKGSDIRQSCDSTLNKSKLPETHKMLADVQLETESDDSHVFINDKFSERFKLKPDFLASLKAAVKSSLSKDDGDSPGSPDKIPVRKVNTLIDNKVQCCGPQEQVSGIQVVGQHIYVSYLGTSVRKFHKKTGELLHIFDCAPHQISCLYVLKTNDAPRLYTGGSSQHLLSFNAVTGQPLRSENLEDKLQCFHHNWGKLFIGTFTGSILVWSTKTDRNIDAYVCSDRPISCISSATEGAQKVILVAAYDSTVFVLSATSGLLIRILEGHTKTVFSLQVDGHVVFSGSGDKTVIEHNLQTGDLTWTYTQATGIITSVCVYDDLLFCASFDKLIRCYTREDRKLKSLFYGANRGLVTQMTVSDDKLITGNRYGVVEICPINKDKGTTCQFEGCHYMFGVKQHLLFHLMSDHVTPNTNMFRCLWKGCKDWLSTRESLEEAENHMKTHLLEL